MADWETGYIMAELCSGRFFRENAPLLTVRTVGLTDGRVKTMGGLTVIPDITLDEVSVSEESLLILPGGNTWGDAKHIPVINKAKEILLKRPTPHGFSTVPAWLIGLCRMRLTKTTSPLRT